MLSLNDVLTQILTQCSYSPELKNNLHNEMLQIIPKYNTLHPELRPGCQSTPSALLLLRGLLPIFYNSVQYRIPIKITYPATYPNYPIELFVEPTPDMIINESNENLSSDGRVTLTVIKKWKKNYRTNDVLEEAKKSFGKKIPVYSKQKVISVQSYPNPQPVEPQKHSGMFSSAMNFISYSASSIKSSVGPLFSSENNGPKQADIPKNAPPVQNNFPTKSSQILYNQPGALNPTVAPPKVVSQPPPSSAINNSRINIESLKAIYLATKNNLKEEIKLLTVESENLKKNIPQINSSLEKFQEEIEVGMSKKELLKASIKNCNEWIRECSNQNQVIVDETELVEYKNEYSKTCLLMMAEEKSLEATALAITEAMFKGVIQSKDGFTMLKQLYSEIFMKGRMREKILHMETTYSSGVIHTN